MNEYVAMTITPTHAHRADGIVVELIWCDTHRALVVGARGQVADLARDVFDTEYRPLDTPTQQGDQP